MFAPIYPPELVELIQNGMFVPMPSPVGRGGPRGYPYPMGMAPVQMMHPMQYSPPRNGACPGEGPPQMRKLFIGGLSHETSDEALRAYFSQWGPVVDAIVIREPNTKQSRGFGFVTFAAIASAEAAMNDKPHVIGGKNVDSKRAIPREQMQPLFPTPCFDEDPHGCKLAISVFADSQVMVWNYRAVDILRCYFETFGSLNQIEIMNEGGHGFVIYEEKESADKCLNHNKGHHAIPEHKLRIRVGPYVTYHKPRGNTYWRRPAQTIYDQLSNLTISPHANPQFDEDSSYGGTTTEDDCKSSEHGSTSSALDTDSPSNNSQ